MSLIDSWQLLLVGIAAAAAWANYRYEGRDRR